MEKRNKPSSVWKNIFIGRQYQTVGGDWSTIFYARFTDWTGKRRVFPLGSDLKTAREELKVLEARNIRREDFDKYKPTEEKTGAMTFAEWGQKYSQPARRQRQEIG